jgi:pimeloyl-ACP methyl ester carboxylesterase
MFQEKTFVADHMIINCADGPASGPPLVFLHGIAGSWQEYAPFFRHFTAAWHVYACDLRGHGRSSRSDGAYALTDYVSDIASILRRQFREPAVLVGHSLGAMTALGTAALLPERVRALVLLDPPLPADELRLERFPELREFLGWMRDTAASAGGLDEVITAYQDVAPGADEASIRGAAWSISRVAPEALDVARNDQLLAGFDVRQTLAQVKCPTLLLHGDPGRGAVMREEDIAFVRAAVPKVHVVTIPRTGHMLHEEEPGLVRAHIEGFLGALRPREFRKPN